MRYFIFVMIALGLVSCGGGRKAPTPTTQVHQPAPNFVGGNPKYADSSPVDWPSHKPWQYPVHGVDVARYQLGLDWKKLRRNGISFGYIKATEGGDYTDPEFFTHWSRAAQAGVPRGAYHFYYFCRTAREQAEWYIRNVPVDKNALPPVLDIEWNHGSRTCRKKPDPETIRADMREFLRIVSRHYGKTPMIYTTVDFYHENDLSKVNGYPFWLRSVAAHPSEIYPDERWTLWQYTGTGRVPGSPGDIDLNVFAGSRESWALWLAKNGVARP